MSGAAETSTPEGSWVPFIVLFLVALVWWASFGQSQRAVKFRRWYNLQVGSLNHLAEIRMMLVDDSFSTHSVIFSRRESNGRKSWDYETRAFIRTGLPETGPTKDTNVKGDRNESYHYSWILRSTNIYIEWRVAGNMGPMWTSNI